MGIKGTVRRSTDGHIIHANIDTDVIIAEEPPYGQYRCLCLWHHWPLFCIHQFYIYALYYLWSFSFWNWVVISITFMFHWSGVMHGSVQILFQICKFCLKFFSCEVSNWDVLFELRLKQMKAKRKAGILSTFASEYKELMFLGISSMFLRFMLVSFFIVPDKHGKLILACVCWLELQHNDLYSTIFLLSLV